MSDKAKWALGALVALAALLFWARNSRQAATVIPADAGQVAENNAATGGNNAPFYAAYYQTNPGIIDGSTTGKGPVFSGDVNVMINADALSGLTNRYIPMFGFVGVTAIGS